MMDKQKNYENFPKYYDITYTRDDEMQKKIRSILGYDDDLLKNKNNQRKIKVNYNQTVYFEQPKTYNDKTENEKQLQKLISNVFNNTSHPPIFDKFQRNSNIKFNFNINNNFYNSNYNILESKDDRGSSFYNNSNMNNSRMTYNNQNINFNNYHDNNSFKINNDFTPAYQKRDFVNEESMVNVRSNLYQSKQNENNFRKTHAGGLPTLSSGTIIYNPQNNINFIPCINCNNMISIDDIDSHSNVCLYVKEEVIQAELSLFSYHAIEYKLKKLFEHITSMKNNQSNLNTSSQNNYSNVNMSLNSNSLGDAKDVYAIVSLHKYLSDATELSKIEHSTITNLKKILTNIDTLTVTYKGPFSTLILIERARTLIFDKIKIFKEDLKKKLQTKKANERTSGNINSIKIKELEQKVQDNLKLKESVDNEKELWKNKANNLKRNSVTKKPELLSNYSKKYASPERVSAIPINQQNMLEKKLDIIKEVKIPNVEKGIEKNGNKENLVSGSNKKPTVDDSGKKSLNKSIISDDQSDEEVDRRLDARKVNTKKVVVNDINSDVEGMSQKLDVSDITSMASSASVTSIAPNDDYVSDFKTNIINESIAKNDPLRQREKAKYMQFLKVFLKIKFQKLHNSHLGQQIPAKPVYEESVKQNISLDNWQDFILNEIKQTQKYMKYIKTDKSKSKKISSNQNLDLHNTTSPDGIAKKNDLFIIDEETNMTQL